MGEIIGAVGADRKLRGRVALDRELERVLIHPLAVVLDDDERGAAFGDRDGDTPCARIERVLDELLDRACRALDHLAGRDPVDRAFLELADARKRHWDRLSRYLRASTLPSSTAG